MFDSLTFLIKFYCTYVVLFHPLNLIFFLSILSGLLANVCDYYLAYLYWLVLCMYVCVLEVTVGPTANMPEQETRLESETSLLVNGMSTYQVFSLLWGFLFFFLFSFYCWELLM